MDIDKDISRRIPTNIISGFLGVGKTSAILNLLAQKPETEHWAILVNEFPNSTSKFIIKAKVNKFEYFSFIIEKDYICHCKKLHGTLAQLVEQRTENPCVRSSILRGTTKNLLLWRFFYIFK